MKYIHMLPFLDEEDLQELVDKIKSGEKTGIKMVVLYPFLSESSLEELVDYYIKENNSKEITRALPFLSRKKIDEIYDAVQAGTITELKEMSIMPFLGRKKIKEMFHKLMEEHKNSQEDSDEEDETQDEVGDDE